jgi:hypothetical protein
MRAQSANSWAHSAIDNPQMSLVGQSVKSQNRKEIDYSANLKSSIFLMCQSANRKSAFFFIMGRRGGNSSFKKFDLFSARSWQNHIKFGWRFVPPNY